MNMTDGHTSYQLTDTDRGPNIPRAGKLIPEGDRVETCLKEVEGPPTPPGVRKFRSSAQPELGAIRVHRGKADDPDVAGTLVHGISTKTSHTVGSLLNPPQKTWFQQRLQELGETVYAKNQKAPLGRSHDQHAGLPTCYNDKTTFGVKTARGLTVRDIINPSKTAEEVEREAQEGHEAKMRSHSAHYVGEQIDRKYNWTHCSKDSVFGILTPHFNDGRNVGKTLHWLGETQKFYNPKTVWKRSGNREKLALHLGITNMRGNTWESPPHHTVGILLPPERQTSTAPAGIERKPLSESAQPAASQALTKPEDPEPVEPGTAMKTTRTLSQPRAVPDHFLTSSSLIGAVAEGPATSCGHTFGIPSVRSDLPAPRIRRVSDTTNYGDMSTVRDLLYPSVYALLGVHEENLFCPRSKNQIAEIFRNVGVNISEATFEEAWKLASMKHPAGEVCVENFRNALKEIKAM
ncbi:EF-hand domain-containing family member B [Chaetodon trifascialis]|uniref:EF-hand domain-containing family member B n=1 Tax=Chaetodon trifascialis TaxID=109706 RepID=UPI003992313C